MSHFRTLYIGTDYEEDFAPYSEQDENFYTPQDRTKSVREDYKKYGPEYRKNGKAKNAVEFAMMWLGIDTLIDKATLLPEQVETKVNVYNAKKQRHVIANGNRLVKVVDFYNSNAKYDYYSMEKDLTGTFNPKEMLEKNREYNRNFYRKVVGILGHQPQFTSFEELMKQVEEEQGGRGEDFFNKVGDLYWEQPDIKVLDENGIRVDADIRCTEEEYVKKACLPFFAIVTSEGWFEQVQCGWWGTTVGEEMPSEKWSELQMQVVEKALKNPEAEVWLFDCHI